MSSPEPAYRSFGEQTSHYMTRPHTGIPDQAVNSAAAWRGPELAAAPDQWQYQLTSDDVQEVFAAVTSVREAGIAMEDVTKATFPLPGLAAKIDGWRADLMTGLGVKYVTGLPIDDLAEEEVQLIFWGIGHHLGIPGAQNPQRELLGHVKDYGESADDPFVRLYRTTSNIRYHCDATDVVGLLCLQPAKSGGQSRIVSTVTLFNELLAQHPDVVPRLFEPFRMDLRGETPAGADPFSLIAPAQYADGNLRTFYHSDYFRSVERHEGISLTEDEKTILDFYDETALNPDIYLDMWLQKGDMQFISNHTIAHARTAYEDHDDPALKRHLLRLWLSVESE